MPVRTALSGLTAATVLIAPAAVEAPSYCRADETAIFSCDLGSHTVSVCASKDIAPGKGRLEYRFGHLDRVLMTYPPTGIPPSEAFTSGMMSFPEGAGIWLRFTDKGAQYTPFIAVGHWRPHAIDVVGGVQVEQPGQPVVTLACRDVPTYQMRQPFFESLGIKAEGTFTLPAEVVPKEPVTPPDGQ